MVAVKKRAKEEPRERSHLRINTSRNSHVYLFAWW